MTWRPLRGAFRHACLLLAFAVLAVPAGAQLPETLPRVESGDLVYLGSFGLPATDGVDDATEHALSYGGAALGLGPEGSLYVGCHAWHNRLARVSVPAVGETATVLAPCTAIPNLDAVDPGAGEGLALGGSLLWRNRLLVAAWSYYDAGGDAAASHFAGPPDVAALEGPVRLDGAAPGLVGGYMGVVPDEWQAALGGPALTGQCCIPIITRSSQGPAASVFDPDDVGPDRPAASTLLVGYPAEHPLAPWSGTSALYNGATVIGGLAFPAGSRSVLFFGRHGDTFCYGTGEECGDPAESDKGNHAWPYRHQVWAYDAGDLAAVKAGRVAPWDVRPYATWTLPGMSDNGSASMRSATYDPTTRRVYLTTVYGDAPRVHVYQVRTALGAPAS